MANWLSTRQLHWFWSFWGFFHKKVFLKSVVKENPSKHLAWRVLITRFVFYGQPESPRGNCSSCKQKRINLADGGTNIGQNHTANPQKTECIVKTRNRHGICSVSGPGRVWHLQCLTVVLVIEVKRQYIYPKQHALIFGVGVEVGFVVNPLCKGKFAQKKKEIWILSVLNPLKCAH